MRSILLLPFLVSVLSITTWGSFPQDESDLEPEESIVWGELENGIRYAVMPNPEPPGRVSMRLLVQAGSLMEIESQRGLAHFLEHMAFNGSENFPPGELIEYLQRIGMSFGADTNAHTSFDETVYKLELPGNEESFLREGLQVLQDYAVGLLLLQEEIDRERGIILSEKRARDSAQYRTMVEFFSFILPESLIPERLPIGLEEVIETAPREEFVAFYETWYIPERMAVVLVGDIEPEAGLQLITEYFEKIPKSETLPEEPVLGQLTSPTLATKLHSEPELPATTISILSVQNDSDKLDTLASRERRTRISLANRIISRRLEILSKTEDSPISGGSASWFDFLHFVEAAEIELTTNPDDWKAALELGEQQLRKALQYGFTQAEIQEATANLLEGYKQSALEASTRQSRALSSGITASLSRARVFTSPQTSLEVVNAILSRVTPENLHKALQEAWSAPNRFVYVSGNLELENADAKIAEAFDQSQKVAVAPPEELATPDFAYISFGKPTKIVEEQHHEDLGIRQVIFGNEVRFNFKQTDYEAGQVLVLIRFGSGMLAESETLEGIGLFTENTFIRGGLQAHDYDELQRILAGKTVGIAFSVESGNFSLAGVTNPENLDLQLQLLTAYLTAPGYRPEAARLAKKDFEQFYISLEHTAEGVYRSQVQRMLADGSYRFGYAPEATLMSRTLAESKTWMNEPLNKSFLEVSIVGDTDYTSALEAVQQTLATLPARQAQPTALDEARQSVQFPENRATQTYNFTTEIPRALAGVFWPTADFWDITRTRTLNALASIFRDRLRLEVREKLGEGYSPFAFSNASETYEGYGVMAALNFSDPDKTQSVASIISNLGKSLGTGDVTEDELQRALKPIINQVEVQQRDNSYWLNRVLAGSSTYPQQLDFARSLGDAYQKLTLDDLNAAAQKYLGSQGLEVLIVPETK